MKRRARRFRLVGRDSKTGRFIPLKVARKRKATAEVQRIGYRA